jgi:hypothetical protein
MHKQTSFVTNSYVLGFKSFPRRWHFSFSNSYNFYIHTAPFSTNYFGNEVVYEDSNLLGGDNVSLGMWFLMFHHPHPPHLFHTFSPPPPPTYTHTHTHTLPLTIHKQMTTHTFHSMLGYSARGKFWDLHNSFKQKPGRSSSADRFYAEQYQTQTRQFIS